MREILIHQSIKAPENFRGRLQRIILHVLKTLWVILLTSRHDV